MEVNNINPMRSALDSAAKDMNALRPEAARNIMAEAGASPAENQPLRSGPRHTESTGKQENLNTETRLGNGSVNFDATQELASQFSDVTRVQDRVGGANNEDPTQQNAAAEANQARLQQGTANLGNNIPGNILNILG